MQRYSFLIEYEGGPYKGWQRQEDMPSVQGALEAALEKLGEPQRLVQGAGRTDAGVHALGQVAHVDLERPWKPFRLMEALNAHLRQSRETVAILDCDTCSDEFHARFSARGRRYVYRIISRRAPLTVERQRAWNVKIPLDVEAMDSAAKVLLGEHDFTTFRSTECQAKSPIKTLDTLDVKTRNLHGLEVIEITTTARSYLHNQVRSFAGSLKAVGEGRWSADDLAAALEARDRTACAPVAPAHGLYLVSVSY
ncbi:MAG: tRNA pseudouridine(38-40) synthase TruA [Rhizobiaceae bacterium]